MRILKPLTKAERVSAMKNEEQRIYARYISPIKVFTYGCDEDGYDSSEEVLSDVEAAQYRNDILAAIRKEETLEEMERGLMHWYWGDDQVNEKVRAARPTVEVIKGKLVGVCYAALTEGLTDSEEAAFIDYIAGQYSDGWGEGFEQHGIEVKSNDWRNETKEIYVSFWSSDKGWKMTKTIVNQ